LRREGAYQKISIIEGDGSDSCNIVRNSSLVIYSLKNPHKQYAILIIFKYSINSI